MTEVVLAVGIVAVAVAWTLVATGRASIWPAMSIAVGGAGLAAVAGGDLALSGRVGVAAGAAAGIASGAALYLATVAFVLVAGLWPVFARHVGDVYRLRGGLGLGKALTLSAGVVAAGEELFWRGLLQWRLARSVGWPAAAALTWAAYVVVNLAGRNLPIVAGSIVGGAVWGALALWSHAVLPSMLSHMVWTSLMLAFPPGRRRAEAPLARA